MWNASILRRRGLGHTSVREICAKSKTDITWFREDQGEPHDCNAVIRWGCTAALDGTYTILNGAEAIHAVNDKAAFKASMAGVGVCAAPTTTLGPATTLPLVVRPRTHSRGRRMWLVQTLDGLREASEFAGPGWYATPFFDKVAEYRVAIVQGRVVWVASKTPANPQALAWNVAQGGRFNNVRFDDWPTYVIRAAIKAYNVSGLDFGGVDVMVDKDGNVEVLEINSAPSQTSPYRQECFAKAFDYICENESKAQIPVDLTKKTYIHYVHPAVSDKARI